MAKSPLSDALTFILSGGGIFESLFTGGNGNTKRRSGGGMRGGRSSYRRNTYQPKFVSKEAQKKAKVIRDYKELTKYSGIDRFKL